MRHVLLLLLAPAVAFAGGLPDYLTEVHTVAEYETITIQGDPNTNVQRAGKYITPALDDAELLQTVYQNVNLHPFHPEFMSAVFPERFGGMNLQEYLALTQFRATRQYFTGGINAYDDSQGSIVYGFDVYTARIGTTDNPFEELLSAEETLALYLQLSETFHLTPLAYAPTTDAAEDAARVWANPGFPVFFPNDRNPLPPYLPYTQAVNYGRIRIMSLEQLAASEGQLSWQDIVVLDDAPRDIESVVAGVITGRPQGELSHIAIRTARRGTPNAYVESAPEVFAAYESRLVRLTVGADDYEIETDVTTAEAQAWWDEHRPLMAQVLSPDPFYSSLDHLLDMDVEDSDGPLSTKVGGKAANLAKLFDFLPTEHQVPGFAIPFSFYLEFMRNNQILDERQDPPVSRTLEDYARELHRDDRFLTDAAYRSQLLNDFRDHIRGEGVVDPQLVGALVDRIPEVFGQGFPMVRFRSSSNIEDSLIFNGAGLYDSTSVCFVDSIDGDEDGPSLCWEPQSKERTIERGLKKVWASLWNYRAWEERSYFQVPQDLAAMAILVTPAFPDEAANGVAFTGDPNVPSDGGSDSDWALYIINVQAGDASVVSPEPGVATEKDILNMFRGEVVNIIRARRSSLVPYPEWVLSEEQLDTLGFAMGLADQQMPIDLEGYERADVLLDFEFKFTQEGRLIFKQVRPFLRSEIPPPVADDFYRGEIPAATTLCGVFWEGRSIQAEYELLTQIDLVPGTILLPKNQAFVEADLIEQIRFSPRRFVAEPLGRGHFALNQTGGIADYSFAQDFLVDGAEMTVLIDSIRFDESHPSLLIDEAVITQSLYPRATIDLSDRLERINLSSCSYRQLPLWRISAEIEDGTKVELDLRYLPPSAGSGPANLVRAKVDLQGSVIEQSDYWHLVYAAKHHNWDQEFWVLFDEPVGEIYGVEIFEETWLVYVAAYLDENLERIEKLEVTEFSIEAATPALSELKQWVTVIPAAAHTRGNANTNWVSDITLHAGSSATDAHLYFLHQDWENTWNYGQTFSLEAKQSLGLEDVVRDVFGYREDVGAVLVSSEAPIGLVSRTFNDSASGTYGQFIPGFALADASTGEDLVHLIQLSSNGSFRSNIGYLNLGDEVLDLEVTLHDASGQVLDSWSRSLWAWELEQDNDVFGSTEVDDGYATVRATDPDARFLTYASVIDEISGDPIFIPPSKSMSGELFIAAAAHLEGANDTNWRSDVELMNPGDETATVLIEWLGSSNVEARSVDLPPQQSRRLNDVVAELLGTAGANALRLEVGPGVVNIASRTYNDLDSHSYGQFIPAMSAADALAQGESGRLLQLSGSSSPTYGFRTNLGFLNIGPQAIDIVVELFDADGRELSQLTIALDAHEWLQRNDVLPSDLSGAYALVSSSSEGAAFLAYASVIDNRSGDPIFIPALR